MMSLLRNLRIRTRLFLGLGLLALVAVTGSLVGVFGLASMNRLIEATRAEDRAMVRELTETRSRLAEAARGLEQSREPEDAELLSGRRSEAEQAVRNLDQLIVAGRQREQRLAEAGRHRYITAVTWLTLLTGLAVMLSLALVLLYNRIVARPLDSLVEAFERVAAGDLTVSLRHRSRDEIGQVAVATGQMVERLRGAGAQMIQHERLRTLGERGP